MLGPFFHFKLLSDLENVFMVVLFKELCQDLLFLGRSLGKNLTAYWKIKPVRHIARNCCLRFRVCLVKQRKHSLFLTEYIDYLLSFPSQRRVDIASAR